MPPYNEVAVNAVMVLALASAVGFMFLLTAFDGGSVHSFGLDHNVHPKGRWVALVGGNMVMHIPLILVLMLGHITVFDVWDAAGVWWALDAGIMGKAYAIATWAMLLSPIMTLASVFRIRKASRQLARIREVTA